MQKEQENSTVVRKRFLEEQHERFKCRRVMKMMTMCLCVFEAKIVRSFFSLRESSSVGRVYCFFFPLFSDCVFILFNLLLKADVVV